MPDVKRFRQRGDGAEVFLYVEAFLYDGSFPLAFLRRGEAVGSTGDGDGSIWLGGSYVAVGEYVIRASEGEIFSCDPEVFEATYEPAETAK